MGQQIYPLPALTPGEITNLDASKITTGQLAVARGGTGIDGSSAANGSLLIGNGSGYTAATITGGANITVTNSAGGISIASSNPGGTVTSVGLSAPSIFSVSGSPVTGAGTLAFSLNAQAANTVLAGPTSGGSATPTVRPLVAADIPDLDAGKITSGTMATARLGSGTANSTTFLRGDQTWQSIASTLDITGLTAADPALGDEIPIYDVSATANRKVTIERLAFLLLQTVGGRLTLSSTEPVTTVDMGDVAVLYYRQYIHDRIALYDGTRWKMYAIGTPGSLSLGSISSGKNYDVFLYDNAGTLTLELSAAWTNDTTRADALARQDGVWVKSGSPTRRWLGTIRARLAGGATNDDNGMRHVWNLYNRVPYRDYRPETANSWTNTGNGTWSAMNGGSSVWKHEFVRGLNDSPMFASVTLGCLLNFTFAIALDSTTTIDRNKTQISTGPSAGIVTCSSVFFSDLPSAGYHYLQAVQTTSDNTTRTAYGDNNLGLGGGSTGVQSGFVVEGWR